MASVSCYFCSGNKIATETSSAANFVPRSERWLMTQRDYNEDHFHLAAKYYDSRTPYMPPFFLEVAAVAEVSKWSSILDLGTGRGEVAVGISLHAGDVTGVDISDEMLRRAAPAENVSYMRRSINSADFSAHLGPATYSHIAAGRAIQWVSDDTIRTLASKHMTQTGKFVLLSSGFSNRSVWREELRQVIRHYNSGVSEHPDFLGNARMPKLGFVCKSQIERSFNCQVDLNFLLGEMLSRSGLTYVIEQNRFSVLEHLRRRLSPFMSNGQLDAIFVNRAAVYQRA